jgi:hypothetical protein
MTDSQDAQNTDIIDAECAIGGKGTLILAIPRKLTPAPVTIRASVGSMPGYPFALFLGDHTIVVPDITEVDVAAIYAALADQKKCVLIEADARDLPPRMTELAI